MNILSKKFLLFIIVLEIVFSSIFGMYIYNEESKNIKKKFEKDVDDKIVALDMELSLNFEVLYSVKGLFDTSELVTYKEFQSLTKEALKRHRSIQSLEWAPKIKHKDRAFYESLMKKQFPFFQITQKDKSGKLIRSKNKDYYYPTLYLEPYLGNEYSLGFDLSSEEKRFNTLKNSAKYNKLLSTPIINLLQNGIERKGFLTFLPVYEKKSFNTKSRLKNIQGFVIIVFRIDTLIENALNKTHIDGINFTIYDITKQKNKLIYASSKNDNLLKHSFKYEKTIINIDEKKWEIIATPSNHYIDERRTVLPSMIVLISVIFIIFTTFYINLIIQRNKQIESKVKQRTKELNEANEKLKEISRTDSLTKIANRRYFNEVIQSEWYRAIRERTAISIMLIDVDYFKLYNDKYGHIEGDYCLKDIAFALRNSLNRSSDFLARYGGEEFVIILPNTNDASLVAKNCQENIQKLEIEHEDSKISKYVTISIGINSLKPKKSDSLTSFINKADQALYKAKENGRNCIFTI